MTARELEARRRNVNFERLRVLGALGIVCFHTQTGTISAIGYAGLPIFVLIAIILGMGPKPQPLGAFAASKARRLLVPWAAWVGVYLAADLAIAYVRGEPLGAVLRGVNPFFGTQVILWYLPFAFVALVFAQRFHAARFLKAKGLGIVSALAVAAALAASVPWLVGDPSTLPEPAPQFVFAAPGVLWGMAMRYAMDLDTRPKTLALGLCAAGVYVSGGVLLAVGATDGAVDVLLAYGIGLPLVCAAVLWPGETADVPTRYLAPLTYGIYLDHTLANLVLYRIPGYSHESFAMGVPLLFVAAAVMTAVLRRLPVAKRIV